MAFRFSIYSNDDNDPEVAADSTSWGPDPTGAEYDNHFEWTGRGAHVATLGGMVHQDSAPKITDRKIKITGTDLPEWVRDDLETKYATLDTVWHFTDGLGEVFKVRFSRRPRGFMAQVDATLRAIGGMTGFPPPSEKYIRYRYEILLLVVSQPV